MIIRNITRLYNEMRAKSLDYVFRLGTCSLERPQMPARFDEFDALSSIEIIGRTGGRDYGRFRDTAHRIEVELKLGQRGEAT